METHAQTIIVFVILAILSWVGFSILQTGKEIAVTNTSIAVMKTDMAYLKNSLEQSNSKYVTTLEYTVAKNEIQKDILELKAQILQLEKELQLKKQ